MTFEMNYSTPKWRTIRSHWSRLSIRFKYTELLVPVIVFYAVPATIKAITAILKFQVNQFCHLNKRMIKNLQTDIL